MNRVDWELIDDYEFVYLAADLLRRLGFIDVHVQGDGPDGGLDLLATELVPYAISGSQPFRWGIQCKFSTSGEQRSVNDQEIRDIEGILRSDRFYAQDLRGYMLITNRRVSQNVVERLAGINRSSPFRTCHIDGTRLQHILSENSMVIDKYFGEIKRVVRPFGIPLIVPVIVKTNSVETVTQTGESVSEPFPTLPSINAEVRATYAPHEPVSVKALLDTGSDVSLISPESIKQIEQRLGYKLESTKHVRFYTVSGDDGLAPCFNLDIQILNETFSNIEVIVPHGWIFDEYDLWIGWTLLKDLTVLFDGDESIRLWKRRS